MILQFSTSTLIAAAGFLVAAWTCTTAIAQTQGEPVQQFGPDAGPTLDELEGPGAPDPSMALRDSAAIYADDHAVSIEEAMRRLRLQGDLEVALAEIERTLGDRVAGTWIEHDPEFRGVVRVTGDAVDARGAAQSVVDRTRPPIEFVGGAEATAAQLAAQLNAALPRLREQYDTLLGAEVDVRTGEIVLFYGPTEGVKPAAPGALGARADELLQAPVRLEAVEAPVGDGHTRGGAHLSTCTSGFVVRHPSTSTTGYITAGHCGNDQTYYEYGGVSYSTVFIDELRDADQDVQWHTTSHIEFPEFYADSTSSYRPLHTQRNRSSQSVGGYVCHRGKTTGYSCGDIASTTFQPTYPNACPGTTCASVWVRVAGPSLRCFPGDSGGPWFIAYEAYGLYKGQSSSGTSSGDCSWAFYSAPDYFGINLVFD